jgi:hypothetical protein
MDMNTEVKNISTEKEDCIICTETVRSRLLITCPYCKFSACYNCTTRFLLNIDDTKPRCMENGCKKEWSFEFISDNFQPSFANVKYRTRRADILCERERSLLPGTIDLVKKEKKRIKYTEKIKDILDENSMLLEIIRKNKNIINMYYVKMNNKVEEKKEKKEFVRNCPVEECRGFLSKSLKCGICEIHACKDCHMVKEEEHKCNPDTVATVKFLATDTKPCPACRCLIHKIHGCDQMYCTKCHTPFSWTKGTIETGVVHNPHFYEFQRQQNGGIAPRNIGDRACGGLPNIFEIKKVITCSKTKFQYINNSHRVINHILYTIIQQHPNVLGEQDNSELRVKYLMKNIDEKQWISKLKAKMKKQEKNSSMNQILTMFTSTMTDLFNNITVTTNIEDIIDEMERLRIYTNKSFAKIGYQYGNTVPGITYEWNYVSNQTSLFFKNKK